MISKNQLKYIKSLHSKKNREQENCFIVEGIKTIEEVLKFSPNLIRELYCSESFYLKNIATINLGINHTLISAQELESISLLSNPNDAFAICNTLSLPTLQINFEKEHAFFLDDIRDPGNLGTIIRICSWFGLSNLFCSPNTVDLYNPKCIQASMGAFLKVNVYYLPFAELVQNYKITNIYATTLSGKNLYSEKIKSGLIIIGNEANGISEECKKTATKQVTIPSAHQDTESLNAAIATSIIASEVYRGKLN